jgi:hypothetical protein
MPTLTGRNIRTITGYVITLLDYPRWFIEREVDFTHCHLGGDFDTDDTRCAACDFGAACCWLHANRAAPSPDVPLDELMHALKTSVEFLRSSNASEGCQAQDCQCDTCQWLRKAMSFLRLQRHRT